MTNINEKLVRNWSRTLLWISDWVRYYSKLQNYKTPKLRFFAKSPLQVLEIHWHLTFFFSISLCEIKNSLIFTKNNSGFWTVIWKTYKYYWFIPKNISRYTNADLKISIYVRLRVKAIPWKLRILNPNNSRVISPWSLFKFLKK